MHLVTDLDASKRPKLEVKQSTASNGTRSSGDNQQGIDTPSSQRMEPSLKITHWPNGDGYMLSSQLSNMQKLQVGSGDPKPLGSPSTTSPTVLPGYRDSILDCGHQSLPWREGQRSKSISSGRQLPQTANVGDRRASHRGLPAIDHLTLPAPVQHAHRTEQNIPPFLKSEWTNRPPTSSPSTGSSVFFSPRTPMEPPLEPVTPPSSIYSEKSTGSHKNPLPPLRPLPLSPQTTILSAQQSPNSTSIESL
jgi:hypothetical protein